ncbi:MAG: hypothetical protein WCO81_08755 [Cyanobacteriota bacterium ELA615]
MKLEKLFCITSLSISLSSATLAPVFAQTVQPATGYGQNAYSTVAQGTTRVGWISEMNGSTATVIYRNGQSEDIQVSPEDARAMNLNQGDYIAVTDGRIDGISRVGRVVGIVGPIVTVKLNDGEVTTVQRGNNIYLKEGKTVYVSGNRVIAVADSEKFPKYTAVKTSNIDLTTTETAPMQQPMRRTEVQRTEAPAPVQAAPEPAPQPVRGMW